MIYIYALVCPETGTPRYIGKTKNVKTRFKAHIVKARTRQTNSHCANWIRCLLQKGLQPVLSVVAEIPDDGDWQTAEANAIQSYRAAGHDLTNSTSGGDGFHDMRPDVLDKRRETWKKTMSDPARMAAFTERMNKARNTPGIRMKQSAGLKAAWSDPDKKARFLDGMNTPEALKRKSEILKERYAVPGVLEKHSAQMKDIWNTPERRIEATARSKKAWADPEIRERRLNSVRAAHRNPELKKRMQDMGREIGARPEVKAARTAKLIASWADPAMSAKRRRSLSSDATRAKMSAKAKARWANPEQLATMRAIHASPESRARKTASAIRRATPEYRAMMAEKTRKSWDKRRAK